MSLSSTLSAPELWGMVASICMVLAFILGGVWKISRIAIEQLMVTKENTNAIANLSMRMETLEHAMARTERAVS
jgi:flagellar biogenesis protein FliO